MEEAWELVVVNLPIIPNQTVDVRIKDDQRGSEHGWDWSPKHTRLKYQMVTTSIIFFSMCIFTFTETSVPLLGWKMQGDVSGLVIVGAFVLSVIAIWSFVLRSKIEKRELSPSGNYLYTEFQAVKSAISNLKMTLDQVSKPDLSSIQKTKDIVESNSNYIRDNCSNLAKNAEILSRLPLLIDQRISLVKASNQLYSNAAIEAYIEGKTEEQIRKLDQSLFYSNMREPAQEKLAKIPEVKGEILSLNKSDEFLQAIALHTIKEEAFLNEIDNLKRMIDVHDNRISTFFENLETTAEQVVTLNDNVANFVRDGEVAHREVSFDRKWLSYRLPLSVSISLLIVGIPFGIGKIANSILQQKYCWCIL